MNKAVITREENRKKREARNKLTGDIRMLMLEILMELLNSDELTDHGKMNAITLLNEIRHELQLDRDF